MLNADSSTLKSESELQTRNAAPMIPSVAALSCTLRTSVTMSLTGASGSACLSSVTRKLDSSARPVRPSSESARNVSGTNDKSAKYAIIAARCVPRSAKNLANSARFRTCKGRSIVPAVDAAAALAELTELSSQIEEAAIVNEQGDVLAGTQGDGTALASVGRELLERAAALDGRRPVQVEVATA